MWTGLLMIFGIGIVVLILLVAWVLCRVAAQTDSDYTRLFSPGSESEDSYSGHSSKSDS